MNLAQIRFTAKPAVDRDCTGCLFDGCKSIVCYGAAEIAKGRGLPDCDAGPGMGYVYVKDETDPRQMDLLAEEH